MIHGIHDYFIELRRSGRRIALMTLGLHLLVLATLLVTQIPQVRSRLKLPDRPIVRIGYEGPDRFVERVVMASQTGYRAPLVDVGKVHAQPARRGGEGLSPADRVERPRTTRSSSVLGPGDDDVSAVAQLRASLANVPLVQSSELVIESMDEPRYPESLHAQGIEGRVALMALIDTTGQVSELSVVAGSGYVEFEESAMSAVRLARFRPYRSEGTPQEVYALIRYRFRIY